MKNLKYIMATLMVALIVAVVCVACNKDKETPVQEANNNSDNEPDTEVVERKPIATMDTKTGKMTYRLTCDILQKCIDEGISAKVWNSDFVVESVQIEEYDTKDSGSTMLVISAVDMESEKSYKTYLNNGFIDKVEESGMVNYYFKNDFESGNFSLYSRNCDGTFEITVSNFQIIGVNPIPDSIIYNSPDPKVSITCESQGCVSGGSIPYKDMYNHPAGCTACGASGQDVYCKTIFVYNEPNWLQVLIEAISRFYFPPML